jgi:peptidoglycan/xylan/chitin deacetylase (PgdA/CDA1 family)
VIILLRLSLVAALALVAVPGVFAQGSPSPANEPARAISPVSQPLGSPERPPTAPAGPASSGPQITFNSVHVEGPYIAMTFDDGPHGTLTPKLLDLLAARRIKATFFVVGQCVAEFPDILKRAAREGHEIANHSWSHPNLGKMGDEAVRSQMQKTDDAIKAALGTRPTLMRPPYGSITARQKSWIHEEFGYRCIIWDVDPFDWKRPGPAVITNRIVSQAQPGSIILAHDIHPGTVDAMPATLDALLEKGFKFVTVSELLAMAKPAPPKPPATPRPGKRSPTPDVPASAPASSSPAAASPSPPRPQS